MIKVHPATALLLLAPLVIMKGWFVSLMWEWHVVSAFSVPLITISQAIGITMLAQLVKGRVKIDVKNQGDKVELDFTSLLMHPLLVLAFAWLATLGRFFLRAYCTLVNAACRSMVGCSAMVANCGFESRYAQMTARKDEKERSS